MKTEKIRLAELELDPANVRKHDSRSISAIAESLKEFGQRKPVVVTSQNLVVTGNGTVQAAQQLGWADVLAVRIPTDWSDEKIRAFAIADNRTSELSAWDTETLLAQLQTIDQIETVGFSQDELDDLIEFRQHPFQTVRANIAELKPHPANYQSHPEKQLDQIVASIEQHGFYRNIVIANDNVILAGHGVVQACKKMGRKRVPVIRLDIDSNDPRALKVMTSDNEINDLAVVNDRALTDLLRNLLEVEGNGALMGTGFDETMLAALAYTTRPASELQDQDAVAEWVGMADWEQKPKYPELSIKFDDEQAREDFMELIGATLVNKKFGHIWAIWYPERSREDLINLKFEEDAEA
jgi:ParB-like chromosome segregation protein Spo0J